MKRGRSRINQEWYPNIRLEFRSHIRVESNKKAIFVLKQSSLQALIKENEFQQRS